jgi:hypothetical protein
VISDKLTRRSYATSQDSRLVQNWSQISKIPLCLLSGYQGQAVVRQAVGKNFDNQERQAAGAELVSAFEDPAMPCRVVVDPEHKLGPGSEHPRICGFLVLKFVCTV